MPPPLGDGGQDQRFLLRAHALDAADRAGLGRGFEVVERADVQGVVEQRHRLRPDALQAHHLEDRGREHLQQLVAQPGRAGRGDVADARGEVLADAVDRQQRRHVEVGDARGGVGDDLRPGPVGAHPEDVLALQLEQVGDLVEHAGDARVLHGRNRTAVGASRKPRGVGGRHSAR